jgi:hypothetical protein
LIRAQRTIALLFEVVALISALFQASHAQVAMLMEQPYGFFGAVNPTGHDAVYFERICAETPIKLRRCAPDELGSVITRYEGIAGYDWVAIPLIPYLYAVESAAEVPARVDRKTVIGLREKYHDDHLLSLGNVPEGGPVQRGWNQLVGVAYERRIYAFRFATTEDQDDALIAQMNDDINHSRYSLVFRNCADFTGAILNFYFPRTFHRSILPDARITTPKQIAYKLVRYSRTHPATELALFEIPQIPGYRGRSRENKSIAESLITSGYIVPLAFINPYVAGGIIVDYLIWGRNHLDLKRAQILTPADMTPLTPPRPRAWPEHSTPPQQVRSADQAMQK